jgi:branched-chain amino acid transport system substrate-binding protein
VRRRTYATLSAIVAVGTVLTACGGDNSSGGSGSSKEIPITVVADLSGPLALYGSTYLQGVNVAIAEANASGELKGAKFVLTSLDSASTPDTAISQMHKAVSSDTVAILGLDTSPLALPAAPIAQQAGIPLLADSSATGLTDIGEYIYSMANPYGGSADLLAETIAKVADHVSIIYANDNEVLTDYYKALDSALGEVGVTSTGVGASIKATDYSAAVTKAMSGDPKAIVVDGGGPMEPNVITALRRAGYTGQLYGSPGSFADVKGVSADVNGLQYPQEWIPNATDANAQKFTELYTKEYPGETPLFTAVDGYDAVRFLTLAIAKEGSSREEILKGLQAVAKTGFEGPPGQISFSSSDPRQMVIDWKMAEIQDGVLQAAS